MGKHWSVCGNGCAKRKGHKGEHTGQSSSDSASSSRYQPPQTLHGEIGAIRRIRHEDPELSALLMDAYLKNAPDHKYAVERIHELKVTRAKAKLGLL